MAASLPFELEALRKAVNYQRWIADTVAPHLGRRILEVGAGLGSMSARLPVRERLVVTEREPELLQALREAVRKEFAGDARVAVAAADLAGELPAEVAAENFDTVVSFNVLEHVEDDAGVLARLAALLRRSSAPGPRRIVSFVPAHQWAYGSIDAVYGHVRRYSAASFGALAARACPGCRLETRYFNAFGLPGWLLMGRILRSKRISLGAIQSFERLCPYIRGIDDVLHAVLRLPLGQSLLAIVTVDP